MPISSHCARVVLGTNERRRLASSQPVSGSQRRPLRAMEGVNHVSNGRWDARRMLTASVVMLLVGQAAAGTAAACGQRRSGPAVDEASGRQHPQRPCGLALSHVCSRPHPLRADRPGGLPTGTPQRHYMGNLFGTVSEPLVALAGQEALAVAEESLGAGGSIFWQTLEAWFANPCKALDQHANGFWKLQNPPAARPPSFIAEVQQALSVQVRTRMVGASAAGTGAERVLALVLSNGLDASAGRWDATQVRFDAISALASRDDVERHIVTALVDGNPLVLALHRWRQHGVLAPGLPAYHDAVTPVHGYPPEHPAVAAEKAAIASLLARAGVPAAELAAAADTVLAMEAEIANAAQDLRSMTPQEAQQRLPDLPWREMWQAIQIDPATPLYLEFGAFEALARLLRERPVEDWRRMLTCQQARRVHLWLANAGTPEGVHARLEQTRGGPLLLSSWYADAADPQPLTRAQAMFSALASVFAEDVAASGLPAGDRQRLAERFAATKLTLEAAGRTIDWNRFAPSRSFVEDLIALEALVIQDDLRIIRGGSGPAIDTGFAHRLIMRMYEGEELVHVSPGLVNTLGGGDGPRERRWGWLGAMMGHELAHVLAEEAGLSAQARTFMAGEEAALRQRIDDLWIDDVHLDAAAVLEEAGSDLRGLSAARRAGRAEAEAAGEPFDDRAFFLAAAGLHAANPTARQLRSQIAEEAHPPGPFRAELGRLVAGFGDAFGCEPRPTAPFDYILTPGPTATATTTARTPSNGN